MHVSVHILRLAGIYGPGRNLLVKLREGDARRIVKPGQVFNRAHVEDIAQAIGLTLQAGGEGGVWNVADERSGPAAGRHRLRRRAARHRAAAGGAVRDRGDDADGAQLLRRQQARLDREAAARAGVSRRNIQAIARDCSALAAAGEARPFAPRSGEKVAGEAGRMRGGADI